MNLEQVTTENYHWWESHRDSAIEEQERAEVMLRRYAPIVMGQLALFDIKEVK